MIQSVSETTPDEKNKQNITHYPNDQFAFSFATLITVKDFHWQDEPTTNKQVLLITTNLATSHGLKATGFIITP